MNFTSRKELDRFLNSLILLDTVGSQGVTYVDSKKKLVYKISHCYFDNELEYIDFSSESVSQFKNIESKAFIFPSDVITLNGVVVGFIMAYAPGVNLFKLNPLGINLDWFLKKLSETIEAIKIISKQKVNCYDMMYNILLGKQFYFIDTLEYTLRNRSFNDLVHNNLIPFNLEVMYFLVDSIFNNIIKDSKILTEMLESKGEGISILVFVQELREYLKSLVKSDIITLNDARMFLDDPRSDATYIRDCRII